MPILRGFIIKNKKKCGSGIFFLQINVLYLQTKKRISPKYGDIS